MFAATLGSGDFIVQYDVWFRWSFSVFIVDVNTNRAMHVGLTRAPTEPSTVQELRAVTPFGFGPQLLIRDAWNSKRDAK